MKASARQDGTDWVLNGTKHFISHADLADFAICFMASGEEDTPRGKKKLITAFFVDKGTPGFNVLRRIPMLGGQFTYEVALENCRVPAANLLGTRDRALRPCRCGSPRAACRWRAGRSAWRSARST